MAKSNKKNASNKSRQVFWERVWNVICWPFRKITQACRWLWNWICGINLIGLLNCALLVAIIVLFSMLIMDFVRFSKTCFFTHNTPNVKTETDGDNMALPQRVSEKNSVVNVVSIKKAEADCAKRHIAKQNDTFMGDVIIDTRAGGRMLRSGATVRGNLYLQDMNKYVLPCNIKIQGNLFLRDIGILQFCGKFSVSGNIYVTPSSSFGPIPRDAYVGGHVII